VVRWIAFDDDTAEAVVSRLRRGAAEIRHSDPLDAALHNPKASLVILPSRIAGRLLIARFPASKTSTVPTGARPAVPNFTARKPVQRKPWWRKLVA
jgi:hypothetical protein